MNENENIQEQDISEDGTTTEVATESETATEAPTEMENLSPTVSDEIHAEILTELRINNEILGRIYALNVFMLAIILSVLMYFIIKNNFTKHF